MEVSAHLRIRVQNARLAAHHKLMLASFVDPLQIVLVVLHTAVLVLANTHAPQTASHLSG